MLRLRNLRRHGVAGTFTPPTPSIPANVVLPAITGTPATGQTLSASTGTWTGYPTPTYAYQWKKDGTNISGATASTYVPVSGDIGGVLTVVVTATNSAGNASATSAGTAAVTAAVAAPVNTVAPSISGTATEGQTLTASDGTWTGNPTPTLSRVWNRSGAAISGATGTTYTLVTADIGSVITVTVTGSNSQGSAIATSAATATVAQASATPVNTVAPVISGSAVQGQVLTGSDGTWTGYPTPTYTYQWNRSGTPISGATGSTYTLAFADVGATITFTVTASNGVGSPVSATSTATGVVSASGGTAGQYDFTDTTMSGLAATLAF